VEAFILSGLVIGSIYAISALGLVLTYTSSRVFNFAHGAIAYSVAVFYYWLNTENGWSIPTAAVFSVLVMAPLLGLFLWAVLFRHLTHAPPEVRFLSTVGLWVALPAALKLLLPFSKNEIREPNGLVSAPADVFHVFGVAINVDQAVVLIGAVVVVVGLTVVMRWTPVGLMSRATVDSPRAASGAGINTSAMTAGSWMVGAGLAGLAGVLLSPSHILGLSETQFTLLLVASFAAAVVGRLRSLPLTFAGAMLIGLLQGMSKDFLPSTGVLAEGFQPSIPFIVMLLFLLAYRGLGREQFEADLRSGPVEEEAPPAAPLHGWQAAIGPLAFAIVVLSVPLWVDDFWIGVISQGVALAVLFLTFTIATGEAGLLSLCQVTLAGIGAFATVKLATESGWPLGIALLAGALLAVPIGMLVAALSLRLGDLYLALATLAFGLLMQNLVFAREDFTNFGAGIDVARPVLFGIDFNERVEFYLLLAVVFCVVALLVVNLRKATTGLVFAAMRSTETATATIGVSIIRTKMLAFAVSSFIAGLGGGLYAITIGRATPLSFNVLIGIVWLAIVVTWGIRSVIGALLAGILLVYAPERPTAILVVALLLTCAGLIARITFARRLRTPTGAVGAVALVAVAVLGSKLLLDLEVDGDWVPDAITMLFGLGAIFLARRPRGVIFDFVSRLRLRQLRAQTHLAEVAA
jgi:branched-chain amino acid transport system permease protein